MLISELIEKLQKLDTSKTIGVVWEDDIRLCECEIEIQERNYINEVRNESLKEFDYYI